MKFDIVVDARYKSCPGPLLALAEAVSKLEPGKIVKLLATDPAAPEDVKSWASEVGHKILEIKKTNNIYEIILEVSG